MFWIVALCLSLGVAGLLARALRGRSLEPDAIEGAVTSQASDISVYKAQLAEVERDVERGILNAEDADAVRMEISRRLLAADRQAQDTVPEAVSQKTRPWVLVGIAGVLLLASFALYQVLGAPGYPDLPHADRLAAAERARDNRPSQSVAETQAAALALDNAQASDITADYAELVDQLRAAVAERPNDARGLLLLARTEARMGNFGAAHIAQDALIAAKGEATEPDDYAALADYLISAAGGYVSPEAEAALGQALALDPRHPLAEYYTGLMFNQTGRPDLAFRIWERLLRESSPVAPWAIAIRPQIEELALRAGVNYEIPEELEGFSPQAMVQQLNDRLATEGGPAEDWARLIQSYGVLGQLDLAQAIWGEAQTRFAGAPQSLALINDAARRAGLGQ